MKGILYCLSDSRHLVALLGFVLASLPLPLLAQSQENFTDQALQWSLSRSLEQRVAISQEIIEAFANEEQFVTLDGLPGIFAITESWMTPDPKGNISLILNLSRVQPGSDFEPTLQLGIPNFAMALPDLLEPADILILERLRDHRALPYP